MPQTRRLNHKKVGDGAASTLFAQIGQRTLYAPAAPIPVLTGQTDHQLWDVILRVRTSWTTPLAAIIFPGDGRTGPSQERLRRDEGHQVMTHAPA
jgi:hypothetical protein